MNNQEFKKMLISISYKFSLEIMKFIDSFEKKDFSLTTITKQIIRSATSIGANIIEAQDSSSKKDFTNFIAGGKTFKRSSRIVKDFRLSNFIIKRQKITLNHEL